uniref:Uncharacterized protein n=1 Tax=Arundo donax TaxID=35708 RepID=A0A0A9C811_ARUDO
MDHAVGPICLFVTSIYCNQAIL